MTDTHDLATEDDVRRIALRLPEVVEADDRFTFSVPNKGKLKAIVLVWLERTEPKGPRVRNPEVVAIRVGGEADKEALIAADPTKFFTEPHYQGFPAILVRLAHVDLDELGELLEDAWRIQAPKALIREFDTGA